MRWRSPVRGRKALVYLDDQGQWRWHVKAGNGEIIAQGEAYTRRDDAIRGLRDARVRYDILTMKPDVDDDQPTKED